jgi:hypothetical protein
LEGIVLDDDANNSFVIIDIGNAGRNMTDHHRNEGKEYVTGMAYHFQMKIFLPPYDGNGIS